MDVRRTMGAAAMSLVAAAWGSEVSPRAPRQPREIPIEVMRLTPRGSAEPVAPTPSSTGSEAMLAAPSTDPYVIVFRLESGEAFVSATIEVRNGLIHRARRAGKGRTAARLLGTVGYHLLLRGVPGDLHEGLSPLAAMLFRGNGGSDPYVAKPTRRMRLLASDVSRHGPFAMAPLVLEASPLTDVRLTRIVTRPAGGGRTRVSRAPSVPVRAGREVSREELLSWMAGPAENELPTSRGGSGSVEASVSDARPAHDRGQGGRASRPARDPDEPPRR